MAHLSVSHYDEYVCASVHGLPLWGSMQMVEVDACAHINSFRALWAEQKYIVGVELPSHFSFRYLFPD
jgi:hypothetical protein